MRTKSTRQKRGDYEQQVAEMEKRAETSAPGVLDLLKAYERTLPSSTAWHPINTGLLGYATSTTPHSVS